MSKILELYNSNGVTIDRVKGLDWAGVEMGWGWVFTNVVTLGSEVKHEEAALWHELGHIKHHYGLDQFDILGRELAANSWVLENYEGDDFKGVLKWLRVWILSYIDSSNGVPTAKGYEDLKQTARKLRIYSKIKWLKVEETDQ